MDMDITRDIVMMELESLQLLLIPIIGISVMLILLYCSRKSKDTVQHNNCSKSSQIDNEQQQTNNNNNKKNDNQKQQSKITKNRNQTMTSNKNLRSASVNKTHKWLTTNLKGHTNEILDMDFSSNGKYLASCAEADNTKILPAKHRLLRKHQEHRNSTSSDDITSSSSNEDISASPKATKKSPIKSTRNRRQRNKLNTSNIATHVIDIDDDSSNKENENPTESDSAKQKAKNLRQRNGKSSKAPPSLSSSAPTCDTATHLINISRAVQPPLKQYIKLNLQESKLAKFLRFYVVPQHLLRIYGYPVENAFHKGIVEIYKHIPGPFGQYTTMTTFNNYNSKELNADELNIQKNVSSDSGQGSGSSSPRFIDSDTSEEELITQFCETNNGKYQINNYYNHSMEKQCTRCKKEFLVNETGDYLTTETCQFHWGKLDQIYTRNGLNSKYTCCNNDHQSQGCSYNNVHVWSGVTFGLNGPYTDYVQTENKLYDTSDEDSFESINDDQENTDHKVYSLDCEMCFTGLGLEATKVTVVGSDGQMVYENFIRPQAQIVDYNTRFSGITEKDIYGKNNQAKTLKEIQNDLLNIIKSDTLLIGHGLENDLRVLKILHKNIIDTSIAFPHNNGFPYRRALKSLMKTHLNRDIQCSSTGHSSFEDSRACLELMLFKVRRDFRDTLEQ